MTAHEAMLAVLAAFAGAAVLFLYVWWDKTRIRVHARDGDRILKAKARMKEEGLEWSHSEYDSATIHPDDFTLSTWQGMFWEVPLLEIDANTGEPLETPDDNSAKLERSSWPQIYYEWIDSDVVKTAIEEQKSDKDKHIQMLLVSNIALAGLLAILAFTGGV